MTRFEEAAHDFPGRGDVLEIDEGQLVLDGGGRFQGDGDDDAPDDSPDAATTAKAEALAKKYGMRITSSRGAWWGYSEYTPDPGDVSIFTWEPAP